MSSAPEVRFDSVLTRRTSEKRAIFFVFPIVIVLFAIVGMAAVAISRMSGLQTQIEAARQQVAEANKVVEQRDRELREAHSETAVLASAGQGAGVLNALSKDSSASGIVLDHPSQHALAVYTFNLVPAPEGQEYRLIVTDGNGQESLLGALRLDQRGGSFLMARDVPEGIAKVEVALLPISATKPAGDQTKTAVAQTKTDAKGEVKQDAKGSPPPQAPAERKPVLAGALPRPGEAGVVLADSSVSEGKNLPRRTERAGRRGK